MELSQTNSRQKIDNAIFTFGTYEFDGKRATGYKVFCGGAGSYHLEWFMPLSGKKLSELINNLKTLCVTDYKKKLKIKSGWSSINLHFLGIEAEKGIKIKTNISGFLFYSGSFGSSYLSQSELERLIKNLESCIVV